MGVVRFPSIIRVGASVCLLAGSALLYAQTADPTATPPSPGSAPAAKAGTYAVAHGDVLAAPGLAVPNGNLPWALDAAADGKPALVPVHHAAISEPANVADAAPTSHVLEGAHGHTVLRSLTPVFYVHTGDRTENTGDTARGNPTGWVLVAAQVSGEKRTIPHVQYSEIAQGTSCAAPMLCLKAETLPDGWVRLTPHAALTPGEYVLVPVQRQPRPGVLVVYDFSDDPNAALAKDAVVAGVPVIAPKHRK